MANEFIIKNGFHSKGDSQITGSLSITGIADVSASIAAAAGGTVDLTSGVTGTLPLSNGGLGLNSLAAGSLLVVESNNTISAKTAGSSEDGKFLKWNNGLTEFQFDTPSSGTVVTGNGGGSGDTLSTISIGGTTFTVTTGTGNGTVDTSGTPVANDYARFTDGNTIEGRSFAEVKTDLSLNNVENTALSTYTGDGGALDNQYITNGAGYVDTTGTPADNQVAVFTDSNTVEGTSSFSYDSSTKELLIGASSAPNTEANTVRIQGYNDAILKLGWNNYGGAALKSGFGGNLNIYNFGSSATPGGRLILGEAGDTGTNQSNYLWIRGDNADDSVHIYMGANSTTYSSEIGVERVEGTGVNYESDIALRAAAGLSQHKSEYIFSRKGLFLAKDSGFAVSGSGQVFIGGFSGSIDQTTDITGYDQSLAVSGSAIIESSGSNIFKVEGSVGTLFSVDDGLDDVIFAANNISGTPVISANADNTVKLGKLGGFGIVISGSTPAPNDADANIFITGSLKVSGSADFSNATVTGLGALTGNGTSTRVPFYNGTTSLTTNSAFVYTDASKRLDLTGIASVGNSPLRLSNLQEDNTESDKGLVIDSSANVVYRTLGTNAFTSTTIPTNTNQLTNGSGFLTSLTGAILTSGNQTATGVKTFSGAISASAGIYLPTGANVGSFASDCNFIGDRPKIKVAQNLAFYNQNNQQMAIFDSTFNSIISGSLTVGGTSALSTGVDGRIDAKNDVVAFSTSDKRLKDNITPINSALDKVSKIQGIEFDWIPTPGVHGNEGHDVGVLAQEVEAVLPEVVTTRDNGYKAVKYEKIVPLLIESIKELKSEIEELKRGK